jgi:hypothetical protein
MPTVSELGWLAGIADGEGCFYLALCKEGTKIKAAFAIANTNELIMKAAKRIVSDLIGREKRYTILPYIKKQGRGLNKPTWSLQVSKQSELEMLCKALLPYLEGKKHQAQTMLDYVDLGLANWSFGENGKREVDQVLFEKRLVLVNKIKWLNRHPGQKFPSSANDLTGSSLNGMKEKSELHGDMQRVAEMSIPMPLTA